MEGSKPRVRCKGCPAFKNQLVKTSQVVPFPHGTICELPPLARVPRGCCLPWQPPPVVSSPGQEFPCKNVGGSQGKWGASQWRGGHRASLSVCLAALLPARLSAHPCSVCHMISTPLLFPSLLDFGADPQKQQLTLFKAGETETHPDCPHLPPRDRDGVKPILRASPSRSAPVWEPAWSCFRGSQHISF